MVNTHSRVDGLIARICAIGLLSPVVGVFAGAGIGDTAGGVLWVVLLICWAAGAGLLIARAISGGTAKCRVAGIATCGCLE